jgi:hypothetical protein
MLPRLAPSTCRCTTTVTKAISRETATGEAAPMPTRLPALKLMLLVFATPRSTTVKTLNVANFAIACELRSLRLADGQRSDKRASG